MLVLVPLLGIFFSNLAVRVETSSALNSKTSKRAYNSANCVVGNTTYEHGQTFKLDCKTQCVCENGRHACSSLCPNEQLPAPEDTISCRSPRLVEVPGHCCKMWLCENPTADVYATCHNSSSSPWTPCTRPCGIGISTRFTSTTIGCRQLSNLRLCENRKCDQDNKIGQQLHEQQQQQRDRSRSSHHGLVDQSNTLNYDTTMPKHRIRKGHECRSIQRLGPARIRLGACVSKKLYRPKLCGRCHHASKCCFPSVSTTIQVELLCPLNAEDPISIVRGEQNKRQPIQLWDTIALEPIDQEYLQSHQIQIENKFIAIEWILKCECTHNAQCNSRNNNNNNNGNNNGSYYGNNNAKLPQAITHPDNINNRIDDNHYDETALAFASSGEQLPDIIPYPPSNNRKSNSNSSGKNKIKNKNKSRYRNNNNNSSNNNNAMNRNRDSSDGHNNIKGQYGNNNNNQVSETTAIDRITRTTNTNNNNNNNNNKYGSNNNGNSRHNENRSKIIAKRHHSRT